MFNKIFQLTCNFFTNKKNSFDCLVNIFLIFFETLIEIIFFKALTYNFFNNIFLFLPLIYLTNFLIIF